ncbi:hypothetical protein GO986_08965 [Deinococcus sp. HMF7620]|uniref:Uncharacterized protein n=1 Tax=Deinococcus arboris TaxID=2682977 RepID=A0A7C9HRD5_9DEIO|nr:hypothetical protein [Deinococcus arboris]MVN86894.1 hypothetical protein [Deinococcus arboris]
MDVKRLLLTLALSTSVACAQLQVTTPATAACAPDATPVLGIALDSFLDGDYNIDVTNALERALRRAGFKVYPHYEFELLDKASIGLSGEVNHWRSSAGNRSERVGDAHLVITDLSTGEHLLNLDQKRATFVLSAPSLDAFIRDVVAALSKKFCQNGGA